MIAELGHYALILALLASLAQAGLPVDRRRVSFLVVGLVTFSFGCLTVNYVTSDFSVMNVVANSHTMKPLLYKITGVWGNHEGSILLWVWILALWTGFFAWRNRLADIAVFDRALQVQGAVTAVFLSFVIFTSNPFWRVFPPAREGMDLNPLLQDPALALHPPLLYAGYVGFSIGFSLAVAALIEKKFTRDFAAVLRPWVLAAWVFLTLGIAAGSLWAYYELGWGGFWFWDPVENASLLPWLCGLALLHSAAVTEKRGALTGWTLFLAIAAFGFALLGAFLVRSGVLTSVHAFASDPLRGVFLLAIFVAVTGSAFTLYALRAPDLKPAVPFRALSRETMMLLNNVFLMTFTATVFIGTVYPFLMTALKLGSVSVGAPYYAMVLAPLVFPFAAILGAVLFVPWRQADKGAVAKRIYIPALTTLVVAVVLLLRMNVLAAGGFAVAVWIVAATSADLAGKHIRKLPRRYIGMTIAHIGFAVFIAGVTGATQLATEETRWMETGERITFAKRDIVFLTTEMTAEKNYIADRGVFLLSPDIYLTPERRFYPAAGRDITETALYSNGIDMFYVVIGESDPQNTSRRVVRLYHHPLLNLIFAGAALMALGGVFSLRGGRP